MVTTVILTGVLQSTSSDSFVIKANGINFTVYLSNQILMEVPHTIGLSLIVKGHLEFDHEIYIVGDEIIVMGA